MSIPNIYNSSHTNSNTNSPYSTHPTSSSKTDPRPIMGREQSKSSPELFGIDEEEDEVDQQINNNHLQAQAQNFNTYNQTNPSNSNATKSWNNNNNYNGNVSGSHSEPVTPRKNLFSSSSSHNNTERPSPSVNMGKYTKLVRRAGQGQGSTSSLNTTSHEEEGGSHNRGGKKRKFDDKEEEATDIDDGFDPMAAIHVFDSKSQLEDQWDQIQKDLVEFLKKYAEETLSHAYEKILQINHLFTTLNKDAQKNLVKGVEAIEKEEAVHEDARRIITDFSNEIQRAAEVLSRFGHSDNPIKAILAKREDKDNA